ncbi:fasciclin domain-containing protein [Flammeovirga sp. OC4]|uniref:fasciclin domain-containing protein n=1 Tax=Flammeovirga sp. OC4 TaxID=1382345 RepID=UPI0005C53C98|nr:fasciclin domain-containing protein [Flammeovirga sp. OC4]
MKTLDLAKLLFVLSILFSITSCNEDDDTPPITNLPTNTIADVASSASDYSTLVTALGSANLVGTFADATKEYTVFAPTNAAFTQLLAANNGISSFDDLSAEALDILLKHHVVEGKLMSTDLNNGDMLTTLAGTKLEVEISGGNVMVGGAKVGSPNIEADNGVIHGIESVIVPSQALTIAQVAISNNFTSLVAALDKAKLVAPFATATNSLTVFAPTDAAFTEAGINLDDFTEEELQRILQHHVVSSKVLSSALENGKVETSINTSLEVMLDGEMVKIGDAMVEIANIEAINGVVHVIDKVLTPSTIVDVAITAGDFTELIGALTTTELLSDFNVDFVDGELAEYTVLAPTDAAFAKLGDISLTKEQLAAILANHVVPNKVLSTDLNDGDMVETLGGAMLTVSVVDGVITIGGATVAQPNVGASNGIIHIINEVITD